MIRIPNPSASQLLPTEDAQWPIRKKRYPDGDEHASEEQDVLQDYETEKEEKKRARHPRKRSIPHLVTKPAPASLAPRDTFFLTCDAFPGTYLGTSNGLVSEFTSTPCAFRVEDHQLISLHSQPLSTFSLTLDKSGEFVCRHPDDPRFFTHTRDPLLKARFVSNPDARSTGRATFLGLCCSTSSSSSSSLSRDRLDLAFCECRKRPDSNISLFVGPRLENVAWDTHPAWSTMAFSLVPTLSSIHTATSRAPDITYTRTSTPPPLPASRSSPRSPPRTSSTHHHKNKRKKKRRRSRSRYTHTDPIEDSLMSEWRQAGRPPPESICITTQKRQVAYAIGFLVLGIILCYLISRKSPKKT